MADYQTPVRTCKKHKQELVIYCFDCRKLCCVEGLTNDHQGHTCKSVSDAARELRSGMLHQLKTIEKETIPSLHNTLSLIESNQSLILASSRTLEEDNFAIEKEILDTVKKHFAANRSKISDEQKEAIITLNENKKRTENRYKDIERKVEYMKSNFLLASDAHFLELNDELQDSIKKASLCQTEVPAYNVNTSSKVLTSAAIEDLTELLDSFCPSREINVIEHSFTPRLCLSKQEAGRESQMKSTSKTDGGQNVNTKQIKAVQQPREDVTRLQQENLGLKKEEGIPFNRLSQLGGVKLSGGTPAIADLIEPNCPTKIAEQYNEIYDNEWTDAFAALSKLGKKEPRDKDIIIRLRKLLFECYAFCRKRASIQWKLLLEDLYCGKIKDMQDANRLLRLGGTDIKQIEDVRRSTAESSAVNVFQLFEEENKSSLKAIFDAAEPFIRKCITVCWLMNLHNPTLEIYKDGDKSNGKPFDQNLYRFFTQSGDTTDFIVWPPLHLYQGGPLLQKGVAQPFPMK